MCVRCLVFSKALIFISMRERGREGVREGVCVCVWVGGWVLCVLVLRAGMAHIVVAQHAGTVHGTPVLCTYVCVCV